MGATNPARTVQTAALLRLSSLVPQGGMLVMSNIRRVYRVAGPNREAAEKTGCEGVCASVRYEEANIIASAAKACRHIASAGDDHPVG